MPDEEGRQRLGVLGGTFDPVHVGHLIAAQAALEHLSLDRLVFVPARRSPHKVVEPIASADARHRMLEASVADDERFGVEPFELERPAPSYSIDTLRALQSEDTSLHLVIGSDQWSAFGRWREAAEIPELARISVMRRDGEHPEDIDPGFGRGRMPAFTTVPVPRVDVSASMIRERCRLGLPIRYLVSDGARRIIEREDLYS